jgi:hypothetical protein
MDLPSRIKRPTCNGKGRWLHGIIRNVYDTFIILNLHSQDEGVEVQQKQQPTHQDSKHHEDE